MQHNSLGGCLAGILATMALPALAGRDDEEERDDAAQVDFNFGDSCERLEELSPESLMYLMTLGVHRAHDRFCWVDMPLDCVDFTGVVEDFGTLENSRTPGYCRYVPAAVDDTLPPRGQRLG